MLNLSTNKVGTWIVLITVQVSFLYKFPVNSHYFHDVEILGHRLGNERCHNGTPPAPIKRQEVPMVQRTDGWKSETLGYHGISPHRSPLRGRRSTLTRFNPGHTLPLVQNAPAPSAFGVKFHKCAQVQLDSNPPRLLFFLLIHNMGPSHGSNLSQVAVRDSINGIVPFQSEGREVERGYQTFAIDALYAGSQVVVNYSAHVWRPKSGVLELPAFLTFSNASQNDVNMFGPVSANLTLRVNTTDRSFPNHGVHFAGFVGGFFISLVLLVLGFVALNLINPSSALRFCQHRRARGGPDEEYGDCNINDSVKDETFEDKMVDIMILEDPQNMPQALENLEMSSLLHATNHLEVARVQMYKDLMVALLSRSDGRLLDVLQGQLLGMEGRLKEELGVRMSALASQCNMETRQEMEAQHLKDTTEKSQGERLCQHADTQTVLHCSVLLEKLHKLNQSWLQRLLLVRHEEASARVQRQMVELRRVELHKIFCEELEEATRMGEMDQSMANSLQHDYFACQDHLEEVLDVVVVNQRYVLGERQAHRRFLVHSLQSLHSLISDTFSSTSQSLDNYFTHIRRGNLVPTEQLDQFYDKSHKDLLKLRQRLEEGLSEEMRGLRCGFIKRRRELTSDMLRLHRQREKDLSSTAQSLEGSTQIENHLQCWQNLLTAHSRELSDLISTLDKETAADIRKVTTRLLHDTVTEVRAIQPAVVQSLQALVPLEERPLLQIEDTAAGPAHTSSWGLQSPAQDRLQTDGQTALLTLRSSRELLQRNMETELMEQREVRERSRDFFRRLCSSQLTLSEDDRLQMKLEFQKSLSVMDRSLVLPHAVHRAKLHQALEEWRQEQESIYMSKTKVKSAETKPDLELVLFQNRLEERIQAFDKLKELETGLRDTVEEEMRCDRQVFLFSLADTLASQMTALHLEKVQRRTSLLQMSAALVFLQRILIQTLRQRKNSERQNMAHSIQAHCQGLSEAEEQLQSDLTSLNPTSSDPETEGLDLESDCRMVSILQGALHKREHITALLHQKCEDMTATDQLTEDLKEQMEMKRLQENCNQELEFACGLVKLAQVSSDVLMEVFHLLLPSAPEAELLSVTESLCPKHSTAPPTDQPLTGFSSSLSHGLTAEVKEDVLSNTCIRPTCIEQTQRILEKRQHLVEKLFPSVCLLPPPDVPMLVVQQKDISTITPQQSASTSPQTQTSVNPGSVNPDSVNPDSVIPGSYEYMSVPLSPGLDAGFGERLFVFRDPPPSAPISKRSRRKRNFLNFKKNTVVPSNLL